MTTFVEAACVLGLLAVLFLLVCAYALGRLPSNKATLPPPHNPNAHAYRRRGW